MFSLWFIELQGKTILPLAGRAALNARQLMFLHGTALQQQQQQQQQSSASQLSSQPQPQTVQPAQAAQIVHYKIVYGLR